MTLLQLVNSVLTRLREDSIDQAGLVAAMGATGGDPYIRSIVAQVNDAKDRVEDAWQWAALRGTDLIDLTMPPALAPGDVAVNWELPESSDNHYIIKGFFYTETDDTGDPYYPVRQLTKTGMIKKYAIGTDAVPFGAPSSVAVNRTDPVTGNITVVLFPQQEATPARTLVVDRVRHQEGLTPDTVRLLVPSLPVYTLATALASRERGEVGGTPTSELFLIAERHL